MSRSQCRCCGQEQAFGLPRICPECGHVFNGNGWDGIDAHWRSVHEHVVSYEDFWAGLCPGHRGTKAANSILETRR